MSSPIESRFPRDMTTRRASEDADAGRSAKRRRVEAGGEKTDQEDAFSDSESGSEESTSETDNEESERPTIADSQQFSILNEYSKANDQLRRQFKFLATEEGPKLVQKSLETVEGIFHESKWTKDTTIIATDSDAFHQVSNQASVVAQNLSSGSVAQGVQLKDFVSSWKSMFSNEQEDTPQYNWANAGLLFESLSKKVHGIEFLNGPLETERKQPTARARLVDDTRNKSGTVTASRKSAEEIGTPNSKDDTSQAAINLYRMMVEHGEKVPVFDFIHPQSFAKSVEMLFTVSFLLNNGRLLLNIDENGVPYVEVRDAENVREMPRYQPDDDGKSHVVFTLDMDTWRSLVEEYHLTAPLFTL